MEKIKQMIVALALEFPTGHELVGEAIKSDDMLSELVRASNFKLKKEDIFTVTSTGKMFFEYPEIWSKLDKLNDLLAKFGEAPIIGEDLAKSYNGVIPLDLAIKAGADADVLKLSLWKGQPDALENAWYALSISNNERRIELKRAIYADMGKVMREDQFHDHGYTQDLVRQALRSEADFNKMIAKFAEKKDRFYKSDIFIPDEIGDQMLDDSRTWTNYAVVHKYLEKHGDILEVQDYLRRWGNQKSALEKAAGTSGLPHLFTAQIWAGRLSEMIELYSHLPEEQRKSFSIAPVIAQMVEDDSRRNLRLDASLTKAALTTRLNDAEIYHRLNIPPMTGLGLQTTWAQIDQIVDTLAARGERIELSDLRRVSGGSEETCLLTGVRKGKIREIMEILRKNGETLSVQDIMGKNKHSLSVLDQLAQNEDVRYLFTPEQWAGRQEDLATVYKAVPDDKKKFIDIQTLINQIHVQTIQRKFASAPRLTP